MFKMFILILSLIVTGMCSGTPKNEVISYEVDEFKGDTTIQTAIDINGGSKNDDGGFSLNLYSRPADRSYLHICLFSISTEGWEYLENTSIEFLIDSTYKKVSSRHDGFTGNGYVGELQWFILTLEEFNEIVNAKSIKIRALNTILKLNPQQIKHLASFYQTLTRYTSTKN